MGQVEKTMVLNKGTAPKDVKEMGAVSDLLSRVEDGQQRRGQTPKCWVPRARETGGGIYTS